MVDEREVIRLYEQGLTQAEVAQRVGTVQANVSRILDAHDVETGFTKWWEVEEIEFLRENYPPESEAAKQEIVAELCVEGRTWKAVRDKAESLGLTRPEEEYRGSEDNRRILQKATRRIEIDLDRPFVGYVVGVLDTDGYTNGRNQIGLEVVDRAFVDKFERKLAELGFNPETSESGGSDKDVLYACSQQFVQWYETELDRFELTREQKRLYLEGVFEGDGTIHKTGYCMICSTDLEFKRFVSEFLEEEFGFSTRIWQDGVSLVPKEQRERFLTLIDPVIKGPDYDDDDR